MKLVTNKKIVNDLLAEVLLEYNILEANPFAGGEKEEGGGEEAGGDAEAEGGEEDKKADAKPKEGGDELSIKFNQSAVKKYNTNTDWKASEAPVKKITKKGIEVDVAGNSVLVNFDDITESANKFFSKSLKEAEEKLDAEDKKQIKDLEAEMGAVAKEIGSAFDSAQDKIEQEVEEMPEKELNEALGATAIVGFILALPKLVEITTKAVSKLVKLIKKYTKADPPKTEEEQAKWAAKIIDFTHKWHKVYIKAFYYMFKFSGLYKKAGIKDEATKMKVAKMFYYTVVAGLAVSAGIGAIGAFKAGMSQAAHGGEFALGTFEGIMASIKGEEVVEFLGEMGVSTAEVAAEA
jgi:hypothetical protein